MILFIDFPEFLNAGIEYILSLLLKNLDSSISLWRYSVYCSPVLISKITRIVCCFILLILNWVEIIYISWRGRRVSLSLRSCTSKGAQITHSTFKTYEIHFVDWLIGSLYNAKMPVFVHCWYFTFEPIHEVRCLSSLRLVWRITGMLWWRLCEYRSWKSRILCVVPVQIHFLVLF